MRLNRSWKINSGLFNLVSPFQPVQEQRHAIDALVKGLNNGAPAQVLLGVTGSGKTFTVANAIAQVSRPALVISHNKTLAAQLYSELKEFFPHNAVDISSAITIITNQKRIYPKPMCTSKKMRLL